jgi:peptidoglycan hydrolase-like protein with peptidoglycan-binding domain
MKKYLIASFVSSLVLLSVAGSISAQTNVFSRNLTVGNSGNDVAQLQTLLESAGYLTMPQGVAKGYFGSLTKRALIKYQLVVGVPGTGYFGPLTQAKMNFKFVGDPIPKVNTPMITSVTPSSGPTGTKIIISGQNLTTDTVINFGTWRFPKQDIPVVRIGADTGSITALEFNIPQYVNPDCYYSTPRCYVVGEQITSGTYQISVENSKGKSNAVQFTVTQ